MLQRYLKGQKLAKFEQDCHNFFMEVVSTLCFGNQNLPEAALIEYLMDIVFSEDTNLVSPLTEASGSKRDKSDKVSVVKSSLLQLLLEHK